MQLNQIQTFYFSRIQNERLKELLNKSYTFVAMSDDEKDDFLIWMSLIHEDKPAEEQQEQNKLLEEEYTVLKNKLTGLKKLVRQESENIQTKEENKDVDALLNQYLKYFTVNLSFRLQKQLLKVSRKVKKREGENPPTAEGLKKESESVQKKHEGSAMQIADELDVTLAELPDNIKKLPSIGKYAEDYAKTFKTSFAKIQGDLKQIPERIKANESPKNLQALKGNLLKLAQSFGQQILELTKFKENLKACIEAEKTRLNCLKLLAANFDKKDGFDIQKPFALKCEYQFQNRKFYKEWDKKLNESTTEEF